jgi:hypothetical protein
VAITNNKCGPEVDKFGPGAEAESESGNWMPSALVVPTIQTGWMQL